MSSLFTEVRKITVPAVRRFVPAERIRESISSEAEVRINYLHPKITSMMAGVVESNIPEVVLAIGRPRKRFLFGRAYREVGKRPDINWAHVFNQLKTATESFLCFKAGWTVHCYRRADDAWHIEADSLSYPYDFDATCQVIFRDSEPLDHS